MAEDPFAVKRTIVEDPLKRLADEASVKKVEDPFKVSECSIGVSSGGIALMK